ncbi:MAG: CDP-diacylglycerol--serine O-phosphatidyltransferase [Deltaproteobacteria bacterium]|jgi:CDP-diacylglycerol--serine O-phosphatidyltransferase|nr:CDP-diacylglycerol--serine O-phosphatidyltransferase [Deltaproteobacteria bacterium]
MAEKEAKKPVNKMVYILPNLFTLGSMFSAFYGLILAHSGNFNGCAIAILISALLDGMDGKVARLTHSASDFGVQMDSLADAIAFGAAPAYMVYFWQLQSLGNLGLAVAFLFMACGALRLARFNVMAGTSASKKYFTGLPIPAAACALACLVLFQQYLPAGVNTIITWFSLFLTLVLGLLMVSRIPYFAFKEFGDLKVKTFNLLVAAAVIFALVIVSPRIFGFSIFIAYLVSGPAIVLYRRKKAAASSGGSAAPAKAVPRPVPAAPAVPAAEVEPAAPEAAATPPKKAAPKRAARKPGNGEQAD